MALIDVKEQEILNKYFDELNKIANKLLEIGNKWKAEQVKYTEWEADVAQANADYGAAKTYGSYSNSDAKADAINKAAQFLQKIKDNPPPFTHISAQIGDFEITINENFAEIDTRKRGGTSWEEKAIKKLQKDSAKESNKIYRERLQNYQKNMFNMVLHCEVGKKITIDFEKYAHGKDFANNNMLIRTPTIIDNLSILEKNSDTVVLRKSGEDKLFVIQKTSGSNQINTLIYDSPEGYSDGDSITPNFKFSDHPTQIGEPMSINFV